MHIPYFPKLSLLAASVLLTGCSMLAPYKEDFMCEETDFFGQCIGVQEAYKDAVKDAAMGGYEEGLSEGREDSGQSDRASGSDRSLNAVRDAYKESEYREMKKLIDQPVTPLVKPPKVIRTLIASYTSGNDTLFSPRYIWYFVNPGTFVIGDHAYIDSAPKGSALTPFSGITQ